MSSEPNSTASPTPPVRRLDLQTKLLYGVGSVAFGVKDNGFSFLLLLFYNQVIGLPAMWVGFALMIALLFDACIDPVIGQLSDNLRSRWGRRHPFLYAAVLPVSVAYIALWNPPHWDHQALFFYLLALAVLTRTCISFYEIPSLALSAEFSAGYDERSILLSYRYFFAMLGGLSMAMFTYAVLLAPDATHPVGQLNPLGYTRYGWVAATVMFLAMLISAVGTHRYIPQLLPPPPRRLLTLRQTLKEMGASLANRSFIFLVLSTIAAAMAGGLGSSLGSYFNTFFWEFSAREISLFPAGVYVSAVLALISTPFLSRRFGKRQIAVSLMALSAAVGVAPFLLRLAEALPPNHSLQLLWLLLAGAILGYTFGVISGTMSSSMIADVVEASELKTTRRSEGLFFAASAFVAKAVSGFGVLGAATIVEMVHLHTGADPATVPQSVLRNLALIYCPMALALYAIACVLMFGYKITRVSHEETLRQLVANAGSAADNTAAGKHGRRA